MEIKHIFKTGDVAEFTGERGQKYVVTADKEGHLYCSCPGWRFQRKPPKERVCKHIEFLIESMEYEEEESYGL